MLTRDFTLTASAPPKCDNSWEGNTSLSRSTGTALGDGTVPSFINSVLFFPTGQKEFYSAHFFQIHSYVDTKKNTNIYICSSLNKPLRKNMRRNIPTIFALVLLHALILISACIAQLPTNQSSHENQGLVQITTVGEYSRIGFEEARQNLGEYQSASVNEAGNGKKVYFMLGRDLDEWGNATIWIFGVSGINGQEFLVYDRAGWTTIENVALPSEQLFLDAIVTPDNLLKQNRAVIFSNPSSGVPERRDLELQKGVYTLTIVSGSSTKSLTFNATTGALIT
jgi:hypothetical protein